VSETHNLNVRNAHTCKAWLNQIIFNTKQHHLLDMSFLWL